MNSELKELLETTGCRDAADLQDMANVGKALLERVADVATHGPLKNWMPADCPTEIVTDLANAVDEANGRGDVMQDLRDEAWARTRTLEATLREIAVPGNGSHWGRIARAALEQGA